MFGTTLVCKKHHYLRALCAFILSLVLALSVFTPASFAWAATQTNQNAAISTQEASKTAVLTILADSEDNAASIGWSNISPLTNATFEVTEGMTAKELLQAAKTQGLIKDFTFTLSYGDYYLESITTASGKVITNESVSPWHYWMSSIDGNSKSITADTTIDPGKSYQFAYYATGAGNQAGPAETDWNYFTSLASSNSSSSSTKPSNSNTENGGTSEKPTGTASASADQIDALIENLATYYKGTTEEWAILSLAAVSKENNANTSSFYNNAVNTLASNKSSVSNIAKAIITLHALGYDVTAIQNGSSTLNALEKLGQTVSSNSYVSEKMSALWAYSSGNYSVPSSALLSEESLVNEIIAQQLSNGGFSWGESTPNPDLTAMAILALTPYSQKYPQASTAVTKALDALRTTQAESGAFVDSYSGENSCSTAYAILALCAAGEDPTTWKSSSGKSALDGLLSYALTDLSGFGYTDNSNFDNYSTLEAFEALAAYHGFTNAQKAGENSFNLFTQPAKSLNENTEQTTTKKPESTTTNSQTTANENTNSNKQQNNSSSKHKKSAHKTDASNNPEEANDDTSENAAEENFEEAASQANEPSSNKEATSDEQTTGGIPTWLPIAGIALGAALLLGVGIYLLTSRRNNQDN